MKHDSRIAPYLRLYTLLGSGLDYCFFAHNSVVAAMAAMAATGKVGDKKALPLHFDSYLVLILALDPLPLLTGLHPRPGNPRTLFPFSHSSRPRKETTAKSQSLQSLDSLQ